MAWFKVDDKLHAHRKTRAAGKAALGLWVLAGSWCMDNDYDGFVPADIIKVWGCTKVDAERLVTAGLWKVATHKGEEGWRFHDWSRFQPSAAVTAAKKAKEAEAGLRGNHKRWHVDRGLTDPDCEYCHRVPDGEPDSDPIGSASGLGESPPNRPVPVPHPLPHVSPDGDTTSKALELAARADVERLCEHLADRIAEDGSKRPVIGKTWLDAARLLIDRDGRDEAEIHAAIDWTQNHRFWRSNILSMPKLREKYDQLRKQAMSEREQPARAGSRNEEWRAMQERQMARAEAREREMGIR